MTAARREQRLSDGLVATEVIGPAQIAASGARNLADLLEEQAGVFVERSASFGAGLRLQGLPADYSLVLIDGVRGTGRIGGTLDLSRFPVEDIERIEIVKGAASALFGSDAIAGVINIVTRRALRRWETGGRASAGGNRTIDGTATVGAARAFGSTRFTVGLHSTAGFDLDPSDEATTVGSSEQYNVSTTNRFWANEALELRLTGSYFLRDRDAVDSAESGGVFDRTNRTETGRGQLMGVLSLPEESELRVWSAVELFRDQYRLDQRGSSQLDQLEDTREALGQLGLQYDRALGSHHPSIGAEGTREALQTPRLSTGRATRHRGAVYLQDEWTLIPPGPAGGGRLAVMPGFRYDVDTQFGGAPSPRLAARYDPLPQVTLRASYGWGFKAPDFRELYLLFSNSSANYLVEGSTALEPEKSRSLAGSVELSPHPRVGLGISGFYNRLTDRIGTQLAEEGTAGPRRFVYTNVDAATTLGVELSLRLRPVPALLLALGYSRTRTRDEGGGLPLSGQPEDRGTIRLRYESREVGFSTTWRAALVGKTPIVSGQGPDAEVLQNDSHALVDLRVSQRLGAGLSGFLMAENLFDAQPQYTPLTPRSFSGGMGFSL